MPLYEYHCEACKRVTEGMRKSEERFDGPECYFCGKPTKLVVSATAGYVKNPAVPSGNWRKS